MTLRCLVVACKNAKTKLSCALPGHRHTDKNNIFLVGGARNVHKQPHESEGEHHENFFSPPGWIDQWCFGLVAVDCLWVQVSIEIIPGIRLPYYVHVSKTAAKFFDLNLQTTISVAKALSLSLSLSLQLKWILLLLVLRPVVRRIRRDEMFRTLQTKACERHA